MTKIDSNAGTTGFPGRLAHLIGDSSVRAFARRAGVSDTFLRQCLAGRTEPTRTKLIALAEAGGTSVQWLATGEADAAACAEPAAAHAAPGRNTDAALDLERLMAGIAAVEEILVDSGRTLALDAKARLIAELYRRLPHSADAAALSREVMRELASESPRGV